MSDIARAKGKTVDVLLHEAMGYAYRRQGKPMPPELREYLAKHDSDMPDSIRNELLKPGLN